LRKSQGKVAGDPRILGTTDFVERVLRESEEPLHRRLSPMEQKKKMRNIVEEECHKGRIDIEELRRGSRRGEIPRVRSEVAERLIKELGMPLAEVARVSGVSRSAISKIMKRRA
jgi:hypothetical protein